jgi:hypothetical protein
MGGVTHAATCPYPLTKCICEAHQIKVEQEDLDRAKRIEEKGKGIERLGPM